MSEGHSAVLHCPYCADEDLRPHEDAHGAWLCVSCRRVFSVKLIGLSPIAVGTGGSRHASGVGTGS